MFLERVREESPDLPFVLFTGKGGEEVASDAIRAGVTDYLQKGRGTSQYELLTNRIMNAVGRVRDQDERRQNERRFEAIFEDPQLLVGVLDPDGTLLKANHTAMALIDGDCEDVLGKPFWEMPWWADEIRADVRRWVQQAADGEYVEFEADHTRPDGESHRVSGMIRPVTNDSGAIVSLIASARDITERKRREDALDALHDATRTFMEASDKQTIAERAVETARTVLDLPINGLWLHDADADALRPVAATEEARQLLGDPPTYTRDESLTWDAFEDGELRVYDNLQDEPKRLTPETPIRSEIIVPLGEHGVMNVGATEPAAFNDIDISLAQILGNTVEAALSSAEREEQPRAQRRELERQNERLAEFASVVSHDLRNPLNIADGCLDLAREECDSEHLDAVARALARMDTLIEDILTVAREGTAVESTEPTDPADTAEGCWRNVETADATLVADTELTIDADHSRLAQLLENLFANAVEYGGADVTITVGDLDDSTGFYVADDGPGISADERETVFEYGYSTSEEGMGFGLTIVKEIAEAHGWEVALAESADGGARFEITGVEPRP